jgi:hypothetical protein
MRLGTILMTLAAGAMVIGVGVSASWWAALLTIPLAVGLVAMARRHEAQRSRATEMRRALETRRIAAQATVLRVGETGGASRTRVGLALRLEVHPAEGDPFDVDLEHSARHLELARLKVGETIPVRYDPQDRSRVMVALEP